MASTDQQSAFTFRNGQLTIEDRVIAIDGDIWGAIRRHYRHHKLLIGTLCLLTLLYVLAIPIAIIFDPGYVVLTRDQGLAYLAIVLVPTIGVFILHNKQSHLTLENSIAFERVEYVHIRPAGRLRSTQISIVYDDASTIRQIYTNVRGFGETQQYEQAKQVFDAHELEVREG